MTVSIIAAPLDLPSLSVQHKVSTTDQTAKETQTTNTATTIQRHGTRKRRNGDDGRDPGNLQRRRRQGACRGRKRRRRLGSKFASPSATDGTTVEEATERTSIQIALTSATDGTTAEQAAERTPAPTALPPKHTLRLAINHVEIRQEKKDRDSKCRRLINRLVADDDAVTEKKAGDRKTATKILLQPHL